RRRPVPRRASRLPDVEGHGALPARPADSGGAGTQARAREGRRPDGRYRCMTPAIDPLWLPLAASAASDVAVAGGKGASLARLQAAGLPVPPAFILTTAAYR